MEYIRLGEMDFKSHLNGRVFVTFLARDVQIRTQKDKVTKFIVFNMVDKDVVIEARIFGASESMIELVQEGKVYDGAVDIKPYEKSPSGFSCIVYNMDFSEVPPEYFADWAEGLDESRGIIESALSCCYETYYGQLAYPILIRYWDKFSKWTAASSMHHTQLGGLLTHTAEVVSICDVLGDYFNERYGESFINKPLLLCSAVLHDVGKVLELDVNTLSGKTDYSKHSILSTHIMDILSSVDIQAHELGFGQPRILSDIGEEVGLKSDAAVAEELEAVTLLKHCLAAHHGKLEFGSPITSSVPEATILNYADLLSAEMFKINKQFKTLDPGNSTSKWVSGELSKCYKDSSKMDEMGD